MSRGLCLSQCLDEDWRGVASSFDVGCSRKSNVRMQLYPAGSFRAWAWREFCRWRPMAVFTLLSNRCFLPSIVHNLTSSAEILSVIRQSDVWYPFPSVHTYLGIRVGPGHTRAFMLGTCRYLMDMAFHTFHSLFKHDRFSGPNVWRIFTISIRMVRFRAKFPAVDACRNTRLHA